MGYADTFMRAGAAGVKTLPTGDVAPSSKVADLDGARRKRKATDADGAKSGELEPSNSKRFADAMLAEGGWAASNPGAGTSAETNSTVIVYRWNGLHWQLVGLLEGTTIASDWLDENLPGQATARNAASAWEWFALRLRSKHKLPTREPGVAIVPCSDAYLHITKNGIRSLAPDPALGLTYATKIASGTPHGSIHELYKEAPTGTKLGEWLAYALPDADVQRMVQEQCGVCLLPANYSQAAWWWGRAGSGKSTLSRLVQSVLSSVASIRLEDLGSDFGLEHIVDAQLIAVEEVEVGARWDEGRFKPLVSGDAVSVNRKNEKAIPSYRSNSKMIITTNPAPFWRDKSDGVARRLGIVKWENTIPEELRDVNFANDVLAREGKLFLDWLLHGAVAVLTRGRMLSEREQPAAARAHRDAIRNNADDVRAWVSAENVRFSRGAWRTTASIYERYCAWTKRHLGEPLEACTLFRGLSDCTLLDLGPRSNRRINGGQARCYELVWEDETVDADPVQPRPADAPPLDILDPSQVATDPMARAWFAISNP